MAEDFRENVREQIKGFSREQAVYFAWLCAVRALPYLSSKRRFEYWDKEVRFKHLYSVFYALDIVYDVSINLVTARVGGFATASATKARTAKIDVAKAAAVSRFDFDAIHAVNAARVVAIATAVAITGFDAARTTRAAAVGVAGAFASVDMKNRIAVEDIINNNIEVTIADARVRLNNDANIYDDLWKNFIDDLNETGCGYWAKLYVDLFTNRFKMDENELQRRLNVPNEIKEQGALVVGRYLDDYTERLNEARSIIPDKKGTVETSVGRKLIDTNAKVLEKKAILFEKNMENGEGLKMTNNKVFVVHGHDDAVKYEIARTLEKAGFEAIILHEQASGGNTIIEKIEANTDVVFAVALYTACDIARMKNDNIEKEKFRARQNVVFEHGYLIGKLGRKRVCALVKGDIETPSDISGVVYIPLDNGGAWKASLANEMRKADISIDMNKFYP